MKVGDWLSLAGLAVSVIGFGIAIWQLFRTANAAVATKSAIERTEKRMALNHLLVLLPQFRLIESDLDYAAEENDRKIARRSLVSYAHFATEVAALLEGQDKIDQTLILDLRGSAIDASRAKAAIVNNGDGSDTKEATKSVRETIARLSLHIGTLATTFQLTSS